MLAFKADGFNLLRDSPLRYFELHLGYYTRGHDDYNASLGNDDRERTVYIGLGLNVGKVIESVYETRIFNYLQLPYAYLPLEHDFD
jgi:hypothetical protein